MNIFDYAVLVTAATGAVIDLKTRRIPNWLTLTMAAAGFLGGFLLFGWGGILASGKGWLAGMLVFMIPYLLGGMGGGDIKLMGAIGALKGISFIIETAFLAALWGGLLALLAILFKKRPGILKRFGTGLKLFAITGGAAGKELMLPDKDSEEEKLYVPYGAAIFLGVVASYFVDLKIPGINN